MDAIRTTNLTKTFGSKRAVDDVSVSIKRGEIYGFVGQNGAGKSTFMKMVAGLVIPTQGSIEILGKTIAPGETSRQLGALIEKPGCYPNLSGFDNLMVRALLLGLPQPKQACTEALETVGLAHVGKKPVKTYSLGMHQRLGVALALLGSPDILMLDEPFNGLDPQGVRDLRTLLVNLVRLKSITIFISSHVIDQLERVVTRYGIIKDGRLIKEMTVEEVVAACKDYLIVQSTAPQQALVVLQQAFPAATFTCKEDDSIQVNGDVSTEQIGHVLAEAKIPVTGLFVHSRDIEELFVGLMGSESHA